MSSRGLEPPPPSGQQGTTPGEKVIRDAVSRGQESRAEIEKLPTTREQANREFVNGLNLHHDPHQNFSRRWIDDLQRR